MKVYIVKYLWGGTHVRVYFWNDGNWIGIAIPQPNFFGGRDAIDHDAPDGGFL
jgi:hypothetical protein